MQEIDSESGEGSFNACLVDLLSQYSWNFQKMHFHPSFSCRTLIEISLYAKAKKNLITTDSPDKTMGCKLSQSDNVIKSFEIGFTIDSNLSLLVYIGHITFPVIAMEIYDAVGIYAQGCPTPICSWSQHIYLTCQSWLKLIGADFIVACCQSASPISAPSPPPKKQSWAWYNHWACSGSPGITSMRSGFCPSSFARAAAGGTHTPSWQTEFVDLLCLLCSKNVFTLMFQMLLVPLRISYV